MSNQTKRTRSFPATFLVIAIISLSPYLYAQTHTPLIDPIATTPPPSGITIGLQTVMSGLVQPTAGTFAPGDPKHLYIADQVGKVWVTDVAQHGNPQQPKLFLDVSGQLVTLGLGPAKYDERGLLGIAFHPDFRRNHLFYTYASQPASGKATFSTMPAGVAPNCQNVLKEWHVIEMDEDNFVVDPNSSRVLLSVDKPQFNHNGGALMFGPDRLLYLSLGDGGGANDFGVGHAADGNAQTLVDGNILGKILRIDPLGHNSANGQYGIPDSNPFARSSNPLPGPHEIFAYGFRNPWRMSFDLKTGRLYAGDVGQNDIEEVDVVHKGMNYGWPIKEGTFLFDGFLPGRGGTGYVFQNSPDAPAGLVDPIAEYDHGDGEVAPLHSGVHTRQAIIGGFVYRGDRVDALRNKYVFGDYGSKTSPIQGHLYILRGPDHQVQELAVEGRSPLGLAVLGFAQGRDGEIYLLASQTGTVLGTTGVVMRITEANDDHDRDSKDRDRDAKGRNHDSKNNDDEDDDIS
jgi:glucose/arabinose dehydrogenase